MIKRLENQLTTRKTVRHPAGLPAAVLGLAVAACVSHSRIPYTGGNPGVLDPGGFQPAAAFTYPSARVPVQSSVKDNLSSSLYSVRALSFPSSGENGQEGNSVTALYYQSKLEGSHPLILVLPIWGGHKYPSSRITLTILKRSQGRAHVMRILGEQRLIDWDALVSATDEETFVRLWRESAGREITIVKDIRRTIDWAQEQEEVRIDGIGLVGFSHGALAAGAAAVQEPRLAATVIVMGGAHPEYIFAHCHYGRTEKIQTKAKLRFGWTQEEMERRLKAIFREVNPANFPGRADPSRILIMDSARDRCISSAGREALWRALGQPERISFNYTHQRAFLSMTPLGFNWMRREIWSFLDRTLQIMGASRAPSGAGM